MAEFWPAAGRIRRLATATATVLLSAALITGCGQLPSDPFGAGAEPTHAVPETAAPTPASEPAGEAASNTPRTPSPTQQATKKSSPKPSKKAEPDKPATSKKPAAPKTSAQPKTIYAPGTSGDGVRELQARLKQIDWFSGKVTDFYGDSTTSAVRGFQKKRDLPATGTVDEITWNKLTAMTREPTNDELHNVEPAGPPILQVGDEGDKVRELQARLKQLAWFSDSVTGFYGDVTASAVKGFQGKREIPATGAVDQKTWDKLVGMSKQPTKDELTDKPDKPSNDGGNTSGLDSRCLTGRAMCIDKTTNQLVWVIDGTPQLRFDVRFGSVQTPTREGAFSLGWKAREWTSTLYDSEMPFAMFFSGGQAVHYSSDFAARGYNGASHGCVNVRDRAGIESLFNQAQVGDKVIVYRS